ncbi:MAG: enoyl-CoA hydratase-related protein [Pseudomonadota bacterium]
MVIAERTEHWLTLTLDRPAARNALSNALIETLVDELEKAAQDREVRGITLQGAGQVFCAGGDINEFAAVHADIPEAFERVFANSIRTGELLRVVAEQPQPVVAAVHGAAIAGGLGLMAAADIVIAAANTRFALTETRLGIVPAQIAPWISARTGTNIAKRLMLSGRRFNSDEALAYGLIDRLVDEESDLAGQVRDVQSDILRCAPEANRRTKRLMRSLVNPVSDEQIASAAKTFTEALTSDEGHQGVAGFLKQKAPPWSPQER